MKIENLQNELVNAQAEYEVAFNTFVTEKERITDICLSIIKAYLTENAIAVRPNVGVSYYEGRGLEFRCEVGFQAEGKTEGWLDFASDFTFYFEDSKLKINHGTSGSFSLDDVTLVKRISVMANVLQHGREIEEQFKQIDVTKYIMLKKEKYAKEFAINDIKKEIQQANHEATVRSLEVGNVYGYTDKAERWDIMIPDIYRQDGRVDTFEITKLTDKFVWLEVVRTYNHDTIYGAAGTQQKWDKKIRKDVLVSFIMSEKLDCLERKLG